MKLYRTTHAALVEEDGMFYSLGTLASAADWDSLICNPGLQGKALAAVRNNRSVPQFEAATILAPIGTQEVWAAGVTYYRSRTARMEESKDARGGSFYDRVYVAERPELFFKAAACRVVGPAKPVRIRSDAKWSVPEPELTLLINPAGEIIGCTAGNDMSSRDIEGENPLYLPQAKVYDGGCALGPCILLTSDPSRETAIRMEILRDAKQVFSGNTTLHELKREPSELAAWLYRENSFPCGAFLMTGTGIVPPDEFSLAHGDVIRIEIDGIGVLENRVA
jgi:2-dehydro-3-deoxy-D-arabinonate dehydratase